MKVRRMPYRKQFTGSPWQQGGPPFGMNQMGGGMGGSGFDGFGGGGPMGMGGMDSQFAMGMMGSGFGRNQGYGGYGGMGPMGMNMGYGMGGMSRMKDRRGNQQNFRNQRKRPMQSRSPVGNQRNKRANYDMSMNQRNRVRRRSRNNKMGGRNNYGRQGRNSSTGRRRRPEGQRGKDEDADKDSESVDGELYNPAEPTDDFSEYEYEDGDDMDEEQEGEKDKGEKDAEASSEKPKTEDKAEKAEGDTEGKPEVEGKSDEKSDETDKEKSKNGIQVTIQQGAKGRSVSQERKSGSRKSLVCHVCKIVCSTQEKFRNHMNGRGHKEKMETLLVLQREKAQALEARMKASHHMRTDSSKSSGKGKKNQNWCTVCECAFVGNFLSHRRTKEHRRKRDKKYPKCRPCRMGFSNADEYKEHCTSEEHKKKASQFHSSFRSQDSDDDYVIVDATGIFEDEDRKKHQDEKAARAISEQLKDLMQVEPMEEVPSEKTEESENAEEKKGEEKTEEKPVATSAVLLINGYYCKLCYKFFGGGTPAKAEHCKNKRHIDNYKRSLPRPKKEPTSEKDKTKEADKTKEEDKVKESDKVKDDEKSKEKSTESKNTSDEKTEENQDEDITEKTGSELPQVEEESEEKIEAMDTEQTETKEENEKDTDAVQETAEKPDADGNMETDDKDQSFNSAKDNEDESETADKEDDTEKSSPGVVRRGRSARGRGRKRT